MTNQKHLKSRVRARMARTGESYASARAHVVEGGASPGSRAGSRRLRHACRDDRDPGAGRIRRHRPVRRAGPRRGRRDRGRGVRVPLPRLLEPVPGGSELVRRERPVRPLGPRAARAGGRGLGDDRRGGGPTQPRERARARAGDRLVRLRHARDARHPDGDGRRGLPRRRRPLDRRGGRHGDGR